MTEGAGMTDEEIKSHCSIINFLSLKFVYNPGHGVSHFQELNSVLASFEKFASQSSFEILEQ
ncbi:TPA: hypothetical protein DEG21_05765 [Patescibacteria group bacterium]|nr:hypothetical protein [Candidatus Gracilibacteria bacterium]HBY75321.1 hypothetical protein [Candidatus Gracilibacteria bacterium]